MNQTAQGLAALGRGPDTMLVHMAPEEVAGLQALALKHGGTLTINPETGLAEAGFLKNILPMVAGFALGPAGFGLSSAMAGLTVGGITALTSKSLEKGLMAGLGAYGGAGLGEGFMGLGGAGAGAEAKAASELAGTQAGVQQNAITKLGVPSSVAEGTGAMSFAPKASTNILGNAASVSGPMSVPVTTGQLMAGVPQVATATPLTTTPTFFDNLSQAGRGFNAATSSSDAALAFAKANKMPLGALGIAALSSSDDKKGTPGLSNPGLIRPYTYARTKNKAAFEDVQGDPMSSRERQYFNDQYTAQTPYRAPGPEYMAVGGPVEDMSNSNDMAAYMGQDKFDQGGSVGGYTFDPRTGRYTRPGGRTSVGGYTYDPKTGIYTRPSGQGATTAPPKEIASGDSGSSGGSDPNQGPKTDWGAILGDPSLTGKDWSDLTPEQQAKASSIVDPYGIGQGIKGLASMVIPGFSLFSALGDAANRMFGKQDPELAKVEDAVPKLVEQINAERVFDKQDPKLAKVEDAVPKPVNEILNGVIVGNPIKDGIYGYTGDDSMDLGEPAPDNTYGYTGDDSMDFGEPAPDNTYAYPGDDSMDFGGPPSQTFYDALINAFENPTITPGESTLVAGPNQVALEGLTGLTPAPDGPYGVTGDDSMDFGGPPSGNTSSDTGVGNPGESSSPSGPDGGPSGGDGSPSGGSDNEARGGLNLNGKYYPPKYAQGGIAALAYGGLGSLGSYSDGGRLLRGPGDGVSDSIPAMIGQKQKARLADGEFVIPARIVSELGNGSTEAGARQLYAMMDRVQKARRKTVGKDKVATNSRAAKLLPA